MTKVKAERATIVESVRKLALETSNLKPDYESKKSRLVESSLQGIELRQEYDQQYEQLSEYNYVENTATIPQCLILFMYGNVIKLSP